MKYLQNGGYQGKPLTRLTLSLSLMLLAAFWLTNLGMYFRHMSLDPASVATYFRGDDARFIPARSAESMLEVTHVHLPMFALVLLLLTHLVIFVPMAQRAKVGLIVTAFVSALLLEGAGWLVRFVHPGFAWLLVASFVSLQLALGVLIVRLAWFLARSRGAPPAGAGARHRRTRHGSAHGEKIAEIPRNPPASRGVEQE